MSMVRELGRRIRNHLAFGVTTGPVTIGPDGLPVVQVQLGSLELTSLRIVEQHGFASNLPVGTPVIAQFAAGDRSNGVITGSTAPATRPSLPNPDDKAMYGHGFSVVITAAGISITAAAGTVSITAPTVRVNGDLQVTGEVIRGYGTGDQTDLGRHTHPSNGAPPTPGT